MPSTTYKATASDLGLLLHWGHELHVIEQQFEPQLLFSLEAAHHRYQAELNNPKAIFLIAEQDDQPVGYLYAYVQPTPIYFAIHQQECVLEVIYLEPVARGKGLADLLIHECCAWANQQGVWRITVGVYAMNVASMRLFERLGFQLYHTTLIKPLAPQSGT